MRRVAAGGIGLLAVLAAAGTAAPPAEGPAAAAPGDVVGVEHVAFTRVSVPGGLVGPARECAGGDPRDIRCCITPDGAVWVPDSRDGVIYRIHEGQARIVAGCGVKGYRDGPADRAMFDFGVGSYPDVEANADAAGNVYVSDMMNDCLRRVFRRPDGTWWVETVSGGPAKGRRPNKGEWIPARDLEPGGAARFAVAPDGTIYYANWGGIYKVSHGRGTLLATADDLRRALAGRQALADWHVGGSHITPDGRFYWVPGGQEILRFDTTTGQIEVVAGEGPKQTDGPTVRESGFHTVVVVYAPDASAIYTGGGDEHSLRRIWRGTVRHLQKDGAWKATSERDSGNWPLSMPVAVGPDGSVYTFPGSYAWSKWLVRVRFAKE